MKASVTFREEKSPLIRLKFPVNLASFSLASGIAIGDNEDLSLHVGTPPEACPSVKLAYQPNLPSSPLSLIVKAGIGPWGPPCLAALSVSAELRLSRISSGPFFTVHVKPRLGDFSFRKTVKAVHLTLPADAHKVSGEGQSRRHSHRHSHRQSGCRSSTDISPMPMASAEKGHSDSFGDRDAANKGMIGSSHGIFDDVDGITPRQLDKNLMYTPMPFHGPPFPKLQTVTAAENEVLENWGNDYVKVDEFEQRNRRSYDASIDLSIRSLDDGPPSFDNLKDHQSGAGSPLLASASGGSYLNEEETGLAVKSSTCPVPWRLGVDESIRGWSLHAHSTVPLGAQTTLKIQWGVNAHYDWMRGWESPLSNIKLPYLYLEKMSLYTSGSSTFPSSHNEFPNDQLESFTQDDDVRELSPIAALCGSTKRQLQLLYAENQVLKKAMQEMKTQFEQRSSVKSRRLAGSIEDVLVEEQIGTPKVPDHTPERKGNSKERKDNTARSQQDNTVTTVAAKAKRNHAHEGLDALKKLGGLGRGGGNGRHNSLHD